MGFTQPVLGSSARSQLLTVLGELVGSDGPSVWTSALLHVLTGLGLEPQTVRQAIARAARDGWIAGEKFGREVCWTVSASGAELVDDVRRRAESLGTLGEAWDGQCLILMVSVPQRQKAVRKRLYNALSWAGFGNPMPGCWASPHLDRADEVKRVIRALDLQDSTIGFIGGTFDAGLDDAEIVRRAWDLDYASAQYEKLIATFENLEPETEDDLLFNYVALVHEWQQFPYLDPQLPENLLPEWIGRRANNVFVGLREKWVDGAHERWNEVVATSCP